jgi:MFS family permease
MKNRTRGAWLAWSLAALYYFYQYFMRSAPAVMMPQLARAFDLSSVAVASLVGIFYYGYAPFCLIAGTATDHTGPRIVMPIGVLIVATGAVMFGTGDPTLAHIGRFLQGAGGAGAMVGAVSIATQYFPASRAATLIGATQMAGMAGGSAGQFLVAPLIASGFPWKQVWTVSAIAGIGIAAAIYFSLQPQSVRKPKDEWLRRAFSTLGIVFRNPQSILCGVIAGLLFLPTNIFGMIWGVRYLEEAHGFEYGDAVMRSAMVPLGWIVGCPLVGFLSDRIGRRKPVVIAGGLALLAVLAWILFGPADIFPPYVLGLVAGLASGAAMIPFTVIKEVNPPELSGTATGVINLLAFACSGLAGPVFGRIMQTAAGGGEPRLEHYQMTFQPLLYGVATAILLCFALRETGPARAPAPVATAEAHEAWNR